MKEIKGEHEDLIYKAKDFIQELAKVQDLYYESLLTKIKIDSFDKDLEDWLFDHIYNNCEEETFEEYLARCGQ